jgi:hypothetical protein
MQDNARNGRQKQYKHFCPIITTNMPEKIRNKIMKEFNVIFAGCAKNVGAFIAKNMQNINACGAKFKSFQLIIYENDSNDNTRDIMVENKQDNYHYIFEDGIREPARTVRLANARNKLLEKMRELTQTGDYHYLVMMDLDDVNVTGLFVNTMETCFDYDTTDWEAMTANQYGGYYDLWALRHNIIIKDDFWKEKHYNTELHENEILITLPHLAFPEDTLVDVDSAFGGMAIYKISAIPENAKYVGEYYNDDEKYNHVCPIKDISDYNQKCEHVDFHKSIKDAAGRIYINTNFINSSVG